jgi:hypothetical protein
MKQIAYLLIVLLMSAQVDECWAVAPFAPPAPLTDNDEYLPLERQRREDRSASHREPISSPLETNSDGEFPNPFAAPTRFEADRGGACRRSCLYVFMSLRR